jgi:tRNA-dihydrouridine synthase B
MAGVTDLPLRELAWELGAGMVVSEMMAARDDLAATRKSRLRRVPVRNAWPHTVQVAGGDAPTIAAAVTREAAAGADIVDINLGCPAKKVCNKAAGSALLRDEPLVAEILRSAAEAAAEAGVPVTIKIRTGWSPETRNAVRIARMAEDAGIAAITVHGRTRACRFVGAVEYDSIAEVKAAVSIPVFANGDIDGPEKARAVLDHTGADGLYIGRAALGAPWLPGMIARSLSGAGYRVPDAAQILNIALRHLQRLHSFYGQRAGVGISRKHIKAYLQQAGLGMQARAFNALDSTAAQYDWLAALIADGVRAA